MATVPVRDPDRGGAHAARLRAVFELVRVGGVESEEDVTRQETSEYLAKYRPKLICAFLGDDIREMSREDLLGLIGWLIEDKNAAVKLRDDHIAFMRDLRRLRSY